MRPAPSDVRWRFLYPTKREAVMPFEPSFEVTGVDSMLWPRAAEATPEDAEQQETSDQHAE